ncbi:hypothetical protein [Afifella marina]|uniref:Uncharacterized protein n=1 Tax=Afifella marina DSM 2698 TaxID=1120955 RepID=A0A1G5MFA1_AFIMA|nr:hypothetical protein [Afifella marina]MBK1625211.1 hypothetical protein [Afifella marina DSM 2698]MBK1628928.1 hypothetical protein [Afifella marina]MBK5918307.1 hypothetical protein [Afifella marina]RAI22826.1 hypothetical protein CH311_04015 [Afifella marina DSM 2698]SCZ23845.1 hypothetical protein SAMN03080610_00613 [Afifella marina DSM 2698]
MHDDRTSALALPLPHKENDPYAVDVDRIRAALIIISDAIAAAQSDIAAAVTQADIDRAVAAAIDELKGNAPAAYDTLVEIAAKLGDQDDVVSALITQLSTKADADETLAALAARYTKTEVQGLVAGATTGMLTLADVIGYQTIAAGAGHLLPDETSGPEPSVVTINGVPYDTLAFDPNSQETAYLTFPLPNSFAAGGTLKCGVVFTHEGAAPETVDVDEDAVPWELGGVAVDPATGNLLISEVGSSVYVTSGFNGDVLDHFSVSDPRGLVVDPSTGDLVCIDGVGSIFRHEGIGRKVKDGPRLVEAGVACRDITVDAASGRFYACASDPGMIYELDSSFNVIDSFPAPTHSVWGIAIDLEGNLWTCSAVAAPDEPRKLRRHAGVTATVAAVFDLPTTSPRGMTFDLQGRLIISGGPDGALYLVATTPGVAFAFSAGTAGDGDMLGALGGAVVSTGACSLVAGGRWRTAEIDLPLPGSQPGDQLTIRVDRAVANAADNLGVLAHLLGPEIKYPTATPTDN